MVKLDSSVMTHEEVRTVLPWYVQKRLGTDESRRVETHLAACAICRGDLDGLSTVFAAHEQSLPDRPVDEARLDALFARIDKHETERRRQPQQTQRPSLLTRAMQWLVVNPSLAAGSLAAVLIAVVIAPGLLDRQGQVSDVVSHEFSVLGDKGAATVPFAMKVQFNAAPGLADVERVVAASANALPPLPAYRIEQRSPTEFAIVFDSKPSVAVAGQMLMQLAGTPNVADATIDDGAAGSAAPN